MIKQVSIIIVNYNTKNFLHDCLFSIYKHTKDISFEIIVSDNGSIDGSIEMLKSKFPEVVLIENKKNIGFGAANNKGLNIAQGKYIFYLNSDTVLLNNAVKIFHDFWENYSETDELGALGCNLQDMQGNIIHSYGTFPDLNKEILLLFYTIINCFVKSILFCIGIRNINIRKNNIIFYTGQVEYITGADLFLRNNIFACFDERFFLYSEEADLEYILKKNKKKRLLISGPKIIHLVGGSDIKFETINLAKQSNILMTISKLIYFRKHFRSTFRILIIKILILILWLNPILLPVTRKYISKILRI